MGLLLIKGGWEPTDEFPNLHTLVDISRKHFLPHERLPEVLVVPREKTPMGAAA